MNGNDDTHDLVPGGEVDPDSAAGRALDPAIAVDDEVPHREGAFGDDTSSSDEAPLP